MTSAPVKDVGSLMNFVGNRAVSASGTKAAGAGSFGDVMSKASDSRKDLSSQDKVDSADRNRPEEKRVDKSYARKETSKADNGQKDVNADKGCENCEQAVEEAGKKLVEETAKKLGVSEEEVIDAMEELGFGMAALLDAENLTKLVLTLSGEESSLVLLTDEGLYGTMQDLLQSLKEVNSDLMEEFSMSEAELKELLESVKAVNETAVEKDGSLSDISAQDGSNTKEEAAEITVTVKQNGETVKFSADENGNTEQVKEVISEREKENSTGSFEKQNKGSAQEESKQGIQTGNALLDALLQNKVQDTEASFEQTQAAMTRNTDEIMNQILDYMKVQLKPGMDQLEMQLHPASLGSLHIQITSKGGEITAQFHVQNEAVKAALESQIVELKDSLKEQGIKVEAVEVTVESHAFESNLWQGQERNTGASYQENKKSQRRINLNALGEDFEETAQEEEVLAVKMLEATGGTVDYTA